MAGIERIKIKDAIILNSDFIPLESVFRVGRLQDTISFNGNLVSREHAFTGVFDLAALDGDCFGIQGASIRNSRAINRQLVGDGSCTLFSCVEGRTLAEGNDRLTFLSRIQTFRNFLGLTI